MRFRLGSRIQREFIAALLLVALTSRALIPVGFMPSTDRAFSLEICQAGFLASSGLLRSFGGLGQHGRPDHSSHFEHCPFGTAPAYGPMAQLPPLLPAARPAARISADFPTTQRTAPLDRAHPPRAPPRLA